MILFLIADFIDYLVSLSQVTKIFIFLVVIFLASGFWMCRDLRQVEIDSRKKAIRYLALSSIDRGLVGVSLKEVIAAFNVDFHHWSDERIISAARQQKLMDEIATILKR